METLEELAKTLHRPRIRDKYHLTEDDIRTIINLLMVRGELVESFERVVACRDSHDDVFLSIALAGHADLVVSGGSDLLELNPFRGIPVITPAAFLQRL
jgi:putative PIN family toxin of toxin-antitoxin system